MEWIAVLGLFAAWRIGRAIERLMEAVVELHIALDARFGLDAAQKHQAEMARKYPD